MNAMPRTRSAPAKTGTRRSGRTRTTKSGTTTGTRGGAQGTAKDEEVSAVFDPLRRLVHALHVTSRETERRLGVTGAQLFVLTQLRATPSLSINALAERTMTHQSTVSVVVRRLVRRKLVKKVRADDDARRVELTLTAAGVALLRRAPEVLQVRLVSAIGALAAADRRALARGLEYLVRELGVGHAPPAMFFETLG
jgi:MarR family transcriptional regulator, lower aerobic nicotinate degradation pathway regulator